MMPTFGLAIALAVYSRRREQHIVAANLPGMVAAGGWDAATEPYCLFAAIPDDDGVVVGALLRGIWRSRSVPRHSLNPKAPS